MLSSRTTRIASTAILLILPSSLDLFSSVRNGKKSWHVPITREDEFQRHRGWMQGTEQRGPWKPAANIEQVYSGPRERPETLECAMLSNGEDLYTERDKIDAAREHTGSNSATTKWDGKNPRQNVVNSAPLVSLIRSKNKKPFLNHERI